MFQTDLFSGKTVLVTGGGSGIGLATARQFLQCGAHVFIAGRKADKLEKAMEELGKLGTVHAFQADIREPEQVENLANFIREKDGKLDVLINNAGGQFPSMAEDISVKGWQAVVNTNLNGTWYVTQTMAKQFFIPASAGAIVNVVLNNFRGTPGMAHSGAARAAVSNLSMSLAVEWARHNIRVNCIAPGIIQSSGLDNYPPELTADLTRHLPMKRLGSVDEVAWMALFLSSPMAAYTTGETIYVDGGARLWGDIYQV
ncbi:MAG: SDR family oxidoreductase [Saprospiraceae bacterium]|nr:SDR family oxidoreductase [Saprospiraceae bacterium]